MAQVKICGLKYDKDIEAVNTYRPDYIGMILFCPKSSRNIELEKAGKLLGGLDKNIKKVAVTVSPTLEQVKLIEEAGFDYIQIHGVLDEDVLTHVSLPVIRAVNVSSDLSKDNLKSVLANVLKWDNIYGVLFDAGTPGSGETFDWESIDCIKSFIRESSVKLFLAGGLNPDNVALAVKSVSPDAVDVSSGVEYDGKPPGSGKDERKISKFISEARNALL